MARPREDDSDVNVDHEEYLDLWYPLPKLENWAVSKLKSGESLDKIRTKLENDRQTKNLHGGKIVDHIIEHAKAETEKELEVELIRKQAAKKRLQSGKLSREQVRSTAMAVSMAEREILTIADDLDIVILYRDKKGRFTTRPTDVLVETFRNRDTGQFAKQPMNVSKPESEE